MTFGASAVPPGLALPIDDQDQADPDERCPSCGRRLVETYVIGWGGKTKARQAALGRKG